MIQFFIQITENDRRVLIALLIVVILLVIIIGYLTDLVQHIMKKQGMVLDRAMVKLVRSRVIRSPKEFLLEAFRKNNLILFKELFIPLVILVAAIVSHIVYVDFTGHHINLFDYENEGFTTLFFIFEFPKSEFFGLMIPSDWPIVISAPHFSATAWFSYLVVPAYLTGGIWFIITIQAYIARILRIKHLSREIFSIDLSTERIQPLEK